MPRISGKDAEGLMAAYAKVYAPKEEPKEEPKVEDTPPTESSENNK